MTNTNNTTIPTSPPSLNSDQVMGGLMIGGMFSAAVSSLAVSAAAGGYAFMGGGIPGITVAGIAIYIGSQGVDQLYHACNKFLGPMGRYAVLAGTAFGVMSDADSSIAKINTLSLLFSSKSERTIVIEGKDNCLKPENIKHDGQRLLIHVPDKCKLM